MMQNTSNDNLVSQYKQDILLNRPAELAALDIESAKQLFKDRRDDLYTICFISLERAALRTLDTERYCNIALPLLELWCNTGQATKEERKEVEQILSSCLDRATGRDLKDRIESVRTLLQPPKNRAIAAKPISNETPEQKTKRVFDEVSLFLKQGDPESAFSSLVTLNNLDGVYRKSAITSTIGCAVLFGAKNRPSLVLNAVKNLESINALPDLTNDQRSLLIDLWQNSSSAEEALPVDHGLHQFILKLLGEAKCTSAVAWRAWFQRESCLSPRLVQDGWALLFKRGTLNGTPEQQAECIQTALNALSSRIDNGMLSVLLKNEAVFKNFRSQAPAELKNAYESLLVDQCLTAGAKVFPQMAHLLFSNKAEPSVQHRGQYVRILLGSPSVKHVEHACALAKKTIASLGSPPQDPQIDELIQMYQEFKMRAQSIGKKHFSVLENFFHALGSSTVDEERLLDIIDDLMDDEEIPQVVCAAAVLKGMMSTRSTLSDELLLRINSILCTIGDLDDDGQFRVRLDLFMTLKSSFPNWETSANLFLGAYLRFLEKEQDTQLLHRGYLYFLKVSCALNSDLLLPEKVLEMAVELTENYDISQHEKYANEVLQPLLQVINWPSRKQPNFKTPTFTASSGVKLINCMLSQTKNNWTPFLTKKASQLLSDLATLPQTEIAAHRESLSHIVNDVIVSLMLSHYSPEENSRTLAKVIDLWKEMLDPAAFSVLSALYPPNGQATPVFPFNDLHQLLEEGLSSDKWDAVNNLYHGVRSKLLQKEHYEEVGRTDDLILKKCRDSEIKGHDYLLKCLEVCLKTDANRLSRPSRPAKKFIQDQQQRLLNLAKDMVALPKDGKQVALSRIKRAASILDSIILAPPFQIDCEKWKRLHGAIIDAIVTHPKNLSILPLLKMIADAADVFVANNNQSLAYLVVNHLKFGTILNQDLNARLIMVYVTKRLNKARQTKAALEATDGAWEIFGKEVKGSRSILVLGNLGFWLTSALKFDLLPATPSLLSKSICCWLDFTKEALELLLKSDASNAVLNAKKLNNMVQKIIAFTRFLPNMPKDKLQEHADFLKAILVQDEQTELRSNLLNSV